MIMYSPKDVDLMLAYADMVDMYWIVSNEEVWSISTQTDGHPSLFMLSPKEAVASVEANLAGGWTVEIEGWMWARLTEQVGYMRSFEEWSKKVTK